MKSKKEQVYEILSHHKKNLTASEVATLGNLDRTNASRYLNELVKEQLVEKDDSRPVHYWLKKGPAQKEERITFDYLIGADYSLKNPIQKAKAAMLYPPRGLHTLIFGETGTGKTLFAECMYNFGLMAGVIEADAPFITFNCADYAQNPQLLFSHIFGVKKGAYTGADETRTGLVAQADGGILFLDEIHRLPPEGQEMLFTFIDKGTYRPLGENQEQTASVQIIGATTETSTIFLETFNRRIPMQIELPPLDERTLDERLAIISGFLQQESNRLNQEIELDKYSLLAFLLYKTEGNVGQLKRDLKLVCAKSFLHLATSSDLTHLIIRKEDLPLTVQKGLLRLNEVSDKIGPLIDKKSSYLHFEPGEKEVVWSQDPSTNMDVYQTITYKLDSLEKNNLATIDLESLIANDVDKYFDTYMEELSHSNTYQEIISDDLWKLVNDLYQIAEEKLHRKYTEKTRFAFALHVQSMLERIQTKQLIAHPNLNAVRRKYPQEFQLAIEFSTRIEEVYTIEVPMDEIGFITMFLTHEVLDTEEQKQSQVNVFVIMHGHSTASSMLETAQSLLGIQSGVAFDMPLNLRAEDMYQLVLDYARANREHLKEGILLLTDMGSPSNFGQLIEQELNLPTGVLTMTSTMMVLESIRMASLGRSIDEIILSIKTMMVNIFKREETNVELSKKKKAVVVACFTGEGVAKKLQAAVEKLVDLSEYAVIPMQFLEKRNFHQKLEELSQTWDIRAIIGTVNVQFNGVPFFPALSVFEQEQSSALKQALGIATKTEEPSSPIAYFQENIPIAAKVVQAIVMQASIEIDDELQQAIALHLAALMDSIRRGIFPPTLPNADTILQKQSQLAELIKQNLASIEKKATIQFRREDIANLIVLFLQSDE